MADKRDQRFDELQDRVERVLNSGEKNLSNRLTWLFEEFLYNQKKRKVPYEVYCKIRYATDYRPLQEYADLYNLPLAIVRRISAGTYFTWS